MARYQVIETRWGPFVYVMSDRGLIASCLPIETNGPVERFVAENWPDAQPTQRGLAGFRRAVVEYFDGKRVCFDVPLDLTGFTTFRKRVLRACRRIPYGKTASYSDLAANVGCPGAARAVGSTMANNRFGLVVPCHRVIRTDGSLGGFSASAGVSLKWRMLAMEGVTL